MSRGHTSRPPRAGGPRAWDAAPGVPSAAMKYSRLVKTRRRLLAAALALAASACDRGRSGGGPAPVWWVGEAGAARIVAVDGAGARVVAAAPALEGPVRALAARRDGAVVALHEPASERPLGVVLSSGGERLAVLEDRDDEGAPLFDATSPPWAAAEAADGRLWVTGREAPVLFDAQGAFAGRAAALPHPTRGAALLPDGRVLVTFGDRGVAAYAADGASVAILDASPLFLSAREGVTYGGVDAVAAREDGTVVVAVLRHAAALEGLLRVARVEEGVLVPQGDPEAAPRLPTLPSALALGPDAAVAGPGLGSHLAPACAERLHADLSARQGCLVAGAHRGVARPVAPPAQ